MSKRFLIPTILVLEVLGGSSRCVRAAGGNPMTIPSRDIDRVDVALTAEEFDGVLLTGGGDVDPRIYGQRPHRKTYGVNESRDAIEMDALDLARELGKPVLGICRGAQLMNVFEGGTLKQHIRGHRNTEHFVDLMSYGRGRSVLHSTGVPKEFPCVSLHHQKVATVAPGFRVTGRAEDGTPEVWESRDGRCVGVQFHPEKDPKRFYSRMIFRWLVVTAAERAGLPVPPLRAAPARKLTQRSPVMGKYVAQRSCTLPHPHAGQCVPKLQTSEVNRHCPHCAIIFMNLKDREDHIRTFHTAA